MPRNLAPLRDPDPRWEDAFDSTDRGRRGGIFPSVFVETEIRQNRSKHIRAERLVSRVLCTGT